MKTFTIIMGLIAALASAYPQNLEEVHGNNVARTITHASAHSWKCGTNTYTSADIEAALGFAVKAKLAAKFYGRKDKEHPSGRFPHNFTNNKKEATQLDFPAYCDNTADRYKYPIVKPGTATPYEGSANNNVAWGQDRVLYIQKAGSSDATFCGLITHTGVVVAGTFKYCTPVA